MKFPDNAGTPERNKSDIIYGAALAIGAILLFPALIFIAVVVKAFIISTLWHWYFVPFFHVPELPLAIAFGISLMINYILPFRDNFKNLKASEKFQILVIGPILVLLFGWIGTFFI